MLTEEMMDGLHRIEDPRDILAFVENASFSEIDTFICQMKRTVGVFPDDADTFFRYIGWINRLPTVLSEEEFIEAWETAGKPRRIFHGDGKEEYSLQYFGLHPDKKRNNQYLSKWQEGSGTFFSFFPDFATGWYGLLGAYIKNGYASVRKYERNCMFRGFLNEKAKGIEVKDLIQYHTSADPNLAYFFNSLHSGRWASRPWISILAAMLGYNVILRSDENMSEDDFLPGLPIKYFKDAHCEDILSGKLPVEIVVIDRSVTTVSSRIKTLPKMNYAKLCSDFFECKPVPHMPLW